MNSVSVVLSSLSFHDIILKKIFNYSQSQAVCRDHLSAFSWDGVWENGATGQCYCEMKVLSHLAWGQVRSDYMQYHASKASDRMALQLGCLEIRWVIAFLSFFCTCWLNSFCFSECNNKKKCLFVWKLFPLAVTVTAYSLFFIGGSIKTWMQKVWRKSPTLSC